MNSNNLDTEHRFLLNQVDEVVDKVFASLQRNLNEYRLQVKEKLFHLKEEQLSYLMSTGINQINKVQYHENRLHVLEDLEVLHSKSNSLVHFQTILSQTAELTTNVSNLINNPNSHCFPLSYPQTTTTSPPTLPALGTTTAMNYKAVLESNSKPLEIVESSPLKIVESSYKQDMKMHNKKQNTCFVFHLPTSITSADLRTLFEHCGKILSTHVAISKETGCSRGFGYVVFSTEEEAHHAVEVMARYPLEGKFLYVSIKKDTL